MFRDVALPQTNRSDWPGIREEIRRRITASMGSRPEALSAAAPSWTEAPPLGELRQCPVSFEVIPGYPTNGTLLLPAAEACPPPYPAVLCLHGTDFAMGHKNQLSPDKPNRAYAIELARRGYAALALDQTGFPSQANDPQARLHEFYAEYPDWSLDGARLYVQQVGLDALANRDDVDPERFGCIGNSLGGRTAIYLAALEPRIKATVAAAGVSPNLTNLYRNIPGCTQLSPALNQQHLRTGSPPWDYQELIALAAPNMLMMIEPWNDPYNPMIEPVLRCFEKAKDVYRLLGAEDRLILLAHGDGHDTRPEIRAFAYAILDRLLKPQPNPRQTP